ncbi:MAG: tetratricopeptide repeat protein [Spirosomataceae bacterium]
MATDYIQQLHLYQAANSDPASVRNNFVVRVYEFETILADLVRKHSQDPVQHELLLGRRGSGKSSLLRRIEVEIDTNETLREKYIAINLPEEQANVHRLFDLWEEVLKEITEKLQLTTPEIDFEACANEHDYTRQLYAQIHAILQQVGKKAVILLDNFDRILENFDEDAHLLRETLLNYNDLKIIGGSTRMNEHFWRYDKPFYEFFRIFRLEALSRPEIEALLNHWSEVLNLPQLEVFVAQHPGKLEAIRILTDGLPRTLQFFIRILILHTDLQGYDYLRKIMDETTPLYQERLNTLPSAHRKILAQMAFFWEACSTKQLAEACKIESKLMSAHLKQLHQKGLIETLDTNNRNKLYRIAERFFNMWFIVTQGNPSQKRRAKWLSIFLETWYDAHDLQQLTQHHLDTLRARTLSFDLALVRTKAFAQLKAITVEERDEMIELTRQMGEMDSQYYLQLPPKFSEITNDIGKFLDQKNWKKALEKAEEIEQEKEGWKSFCIGYVYTIKNDFGKAETYYLQAIEKGHVGALFNLALLYDYQSKADLAEQYYLQTIKKGNVRALNNLAILYDNEGKADLAEQYYLQAIDKGHNAGLYNLAFLYANQGKADQAEHYYLQAIEKGNVNALNNIALLYDNQGKTDQAEHYYLQAIEKGNVNALNNIAVLYDNQGKTDQAEHYYLQAIEKGDVNALHNLAWLLYILNKKPTNSLALIQQYNQQNGDTESYKDELVIKIWSGAMANTKEQVEAWMQAHLESDSTEDFIKQLLIHHQTQLVYGFFESQDFGKYLKEKYVVLYYATQKRLVPQPENIDLIIPPELFNTVEEIVAHINERQIFYYGK